MLQQGLAYIRTTTGIREVILSGGAPLLRTDEQLEWLLVNLRAIAHGNVIRRHSRLFSTLPQRISPRLAANLAPFGPLYSNTHFNHAAKITPQGENACWRRPEFPWDARPSFCGG